jgi:hypothetical protein
MMTARSFDQIIKDSPSVGDVHIANTGGKRRRGQLPIAMIGQAAKTPIDKSGGDVTVHFTVPILKINDELRTVYGWASVNTEGGAVVTDHQGDRIDDGEIIKAAHEFMANSRTGGLLHARTASGAAHRGGGIVESIVMTPDVQKALGIDLGKTGWFVGYRVEDDDAWELVKQQPPVLKAFSIAGRARRIPQ